jgi:hypothetical protein
MAEDREQRFLPQTFAPLSGAPGVEMAPEISRARPRSERTKLRGSALPARRRVSLQRAQHWRVVLEECESVKEEREQQGRASQTPERERVNLSEL